MSIFLLDGPLYAAPGQGKINIRRPTEIGYFSRDENYKIKPMSLDSLRYYCPPFAKVPHAPQPAPIDMRNGFAKFKKANDFGDEHLDAVLLTLETLERRDNVRRDPDFITWRGMMTKVCCPLFSPPMHALNLLSWSLCYMMGRMNGR